MKKKFLLLVYYVFTHCLVSAQMDQLECEKEGFAVLQSTNCNTYYYCVKSANNEFYTVKYECPIGEEFSLIKLKCIPEEDNECGKLPEISGDEPILSEEFICPSQGRFPDVESLDCKSFYTCTSTLIPALNTCPSVTIFSWIAMKCVMPDSFTCPNAVVTTTTSSPEVTTTEAATTTSNPEGFVCTAEGRYADPQTVNCRTYYLCSRQPTGRVEATLSQCPSTTVFSPITSKCVTAANYECPQTTSPTSTVDPSTAETTTQSTTETPSTQTEEPEVTEDPNTTKVSTLESTVAETTATTATVEVTSLTSVTDDEDQATSVVSTTSVEPTGETEEAVSTEETTVAETTAAPATVSTEETTVSETTAAPTTVSTEETTVAETTAAPTTVSTEETTVAETTAAPTTVSTEETTVAETTAAPTTVSTAETTVAETTAAPSTVSTEETTVAETTAAPTTVSTAETTVAETTAAPTTVSTEETTVAETTAAPTTVSTEETTVAETTTAPTTVSTEETTVAETTAAPTTVSTEKTTVAETTAAPTTVSTEEPTVAETTAAPTTVSTEETTVAETTATPTIVSTAETTVAETTVAPTTVSTEKTTVAETTAATSSTQETTVETEEPTSAETTGTEEATTSVSVTESEEHPTTMQASTTEVTTAEGTTPTAEATTITAEQSTTVETATDEITTKVPSGESFTCTGPGRFPDPVSSDCKSYYLCSENEEGTLDATPSRCPSITVFDAGKQKCVLPGDYQCPQGESTTTVTEEPTTTEVTTQEPPTGEVFACTQVGRFPDPTSSDCKRYYLCSSSAPGTYEAVLTQCPTVTIFSAETKRCVLSTQYQCPSNMPSTQPVEPTTLEATTSPTEPTTTTVQSFVCTEVGRHPDPTQPDCTKYKYCLLTATNEFLEYTFNCPGGTYFNPTELRCSMSYICPSQKTTTSTEAPTAAPSVAAPFSCTSSGRFSDPSASGCETYISCLLTATGELLQYNFKCPNGSLFSPKEARCISNYVCA